ncbi:unnamed protein product [Cladocopium goreaui]|uniref:Serine/threonine-protein kinase ppk15 n=1 Tax=Cladocopium goreaui TaxID=2562237 RepID=A0A9P1D5D2_9DINO|nr:unnamed protein product [Cladocopium goreaui]
MSPQPALSNGAWWTFCAGTFTCFLTGFTYTFGEWSPAIKSSFRYSQAQLDTLALAKDLGNFISMDAGFTTNRFGAHVSVAVGTLVLATSSAFIFLSLGHDVPFAAMIVLFAIFGHSMSFCDNAGISTSVKNFPQSKGSAVGLMKAMEGLTAAVINTVFFSFCSDAQLNYFPLWIAGSTLGTGLFAVPLIAMTDSPVEEDEHRVSSKFRFLTGALLVYTAFCGIVVYLKAYILPVAVVAVLMPLGLFLLTMGGSASPRAQSLLDNGQQRSDRPNLSAWEMLLRVDFYLLFYVFIAVQGAGLLLSNNFSQIVKAVSHDPHASSAGYLTIFSIFNTCGRIFVGFGSEALKAQVNRPWFLAISATLMTVAFLFLHLGKSFLAFSAGLVGFGLGGSFALQAVVIEEVFGPKEMPIKYSCCFCAACIGSLVLSDLLAGLLYDMAAKEQGQTICLGPSCFGVTFTVTACSNILAVLAIVAVAIRSRDVYWILNGSPRPVLTEAARL